MEIEDFVDIPEAITTHVSVTCGETLKERFKLCADRLEAIDIRKKKILTAAARNALEAVVSKIEKVLPQLEAKKALDDKAS